MKDSDLISKLKDQFNGHDAITTEEITNLLSKLLPDISPSTISWRINKLKKKEELFQIGRGLYSFEFKPNFIPDLSLKSKRLYNRIKSIYNGEIVIWDTDLLTMISGVEINKHWIFVALQKDDLSKLFDDMLDFSKKVYLQPDKETSNRYVINQDEAVILTSLVSETPTNKIGGYSLPTIEAILVNAWFESVQYLEPIGFDIRLLYKAAFEKYNVNKSKLLRYAARRDKRNEISKILKSII